MTKQEAIDLGFASQKGFRCPLTGDLALAWKEGRDRARSIERKDRAGLLRPIWRRKGEQRRYTPSHCK